MAKDFLTVRKGLVFRPTAIEPENPKDGDWYFSDGTLRDAGLWVYKDGAWTASGGTGGIGSGGPSTTKTADYTVIDPDDFGKIINVDSTLGSISITLPASPSVGFTVTVKDYKGTSVTNKIFVISTGNTDGAASIEVLETNYTAVTFISDGTNWFRVGRFYGDYPEKRALYGGGFVSSASVNTIDYFDMFSTANGLDFGDLSTARYSLGSASSKTRGLWASGDTAGGGTGVNTIDYVEMATLGNALGFGQITVIRNALHGCGNNIRGLFGGGLTSGAGTYRNVIDYVTFVTISNAIDFGDLTVPRAQVAGCSSPIRAIWAGGNDPTKYNVIDYVTIATLGNAVDFGDLFEAATDMAGCSSGVRGVFAGGNGTVNYRNVIEYVTIATAANALDFGDLTVGKSSVSGTSNSIMGFFLGGDIGASTATNVIESIVFATTGNAADFADITQARYFGAACSASHGGL